MGRQRRSASAFGRSPDSRGGSRIEIGEALCGRRSRASCTAAKSSIAIRRCLQDEDDNLRHGFSHALSRAHVRHDPRRYDEWGSPFKTRFVELGTGTDSVLAKDFPELFARVGDDETAIIYWPKYREFGIPVLDGGPSIISISHDPFSGKALPPSVRDEWFATVEKLLGRPYGDPQEPPLPDEFASEAWWIARGL